MQPLIPRTPSVGFDAPDSLAPHRMRRGFTIVEMSISVVVLALIVGSVAAMVSSGRRAYQQGMSVTSIEMRARRALERITAAITPAVRSTLTPNPVAPLGSSTLQFRTCEGGAGGVLQTSAPMRIALQPDPRDADNGIDDDRDGLVDEGEIVLTRDVGGADQRDVVLVRNVAKYLEGEAPNLADDNGNGLNDERGLSFVVDANGTVTVRLTLAALNRDHQRVWRTVETSVHVRN